MSEPPQDPDAFYRIQASHARQCWKEAKWVGVIWVAAFLYCSLVMSMFGYIPAERRPDLPQLVWGIPAWVFWGLFVPWVVLIVVTWLFGAFVLKDDEPYMDFPESDARDADPSK